MQRLRKLPLRRVVLERALQRLPARRDTRRASAPCESNAHLSLVPHKPDAHPNPPQFLFASYSHAVTCHSELEGGGGRGAAGRGAAGRRLFDAGERVSEVGDRGEDARALVGEADPLVLAVLELDVKGQPCAVVLGHRPGVPVRSPRVMRAAPPARGPLDFKRGGGMRRGRPRLRRKTASAAGRIWSGA